MAQLEQAVQQQIDLLLAHLTARWPSLPEVAQSIDQWDPVEQSPFRIEWTLEDQHLARLEEYAAQRAMTPSQQASYAELRRLVTKNQLILDQRLAE
jgi:hypothetical protein